MRRRSASGWQHGRDEISSLTRRRGICSRGGPVTGNRAQGQELTRVVGGGAAGLRRRLQLDCLNGQGRPRASVSRVVDVDEMRPKDLTRGETGKPAGVVRRVAGCCAWGRELTRGAWWWGCVRGGGRTSSARGIRNASILGRMEFVRATAVTGCCGQGWELMRGGGGVFVDSDAVLLVGTRHTSSVPPSGCQRERRSDLITQRGTGRCLDRRDRRRSSVSGLSTRGKMGSSCHGTGICSGDGAVTGCCGRRRGLTRVRGGGSVDYGGGVSLTARGNPTYVVGSPFGFSTGEKTGSSHPREDRGRFRRGTVSPRPTTSVAWLRVVGQSLAAVLGVGS